MSAGVPDMRWQKTDSAGSITRALIAGAISVVLTACGGCAPSTDKNEVLMSAAMSGDLHALKKALNMGADVDYRNYGMTALMFVVNLGEVAKAKLLLERGADVNLKDSGGRTALMWASPGRAEIVDLLRAHGAKE